MRVLLFVACLLTAATPGLASAQARSIITKTQARPLPEEQVEAIVFRQLRDLVHAAPRGDNPRQPVNPLADMSFFSDPQGTAVPDLCRIDELTVSFRRIPSGPGDADTPVTADGFGATHFYLFLTPPTGGYLDIAEFETPPDSAPCRGKGLWDNDYFEAASDEIATDGYLAFRTLIEGITQGTAAFPFTCDKFPYEAERTCVDVSRQVETGAISSIERCEADRPGGVCVRVFVGDRAFSIFSVYRGAITRAEMTSLIVMWHERVD